MDSLDPLCQDRISTLGKVDVPVEMKRSDRIQRHAQRQASPRTRGFAVHAQPSRHSSVIAPIAPPPELALGAPACGPHADPCQIPAASALALNRLAAPFPRLGVEQLSDIIPAHDLTQHTSRFNSLGARRIYIMNVLSHFTCLARVLIDGAANPAGTGPRDSPIERLDRGSKRWAE
jgi:hypothetical protein